MNSELLLGTMDKAGLDFTYHAGEDEAQVTCPLCDDTKQRLYINVTTGMWICFHGPCGEKGGLATFLQKVCELDGYEAYSLAGRIKGRTSRTPASAAQPLAPASSAPAPPAVELPVPFILPTQPNNAVERYLRNRGLDPALGTRYGIGWCPNTPLLPDGKWMYAPSTWGVGRMVVPVYTEGRLVTWVARTTTVNHEPKVLMPKKSEAGNALFNHKNVISDRCILVEGVFDAMRMPDHAIATLGAHLTVYQRRALKRLGYKSVTLLRDGDPAGYRSAVDEALQLKAALFPEVYIAVLPRGVDPGSATEAQLRKALANLISPDVDYGRSVLMMEVQSHA